MLHQRAAVRVSQRVPELAEVIGDNGSSVSGVLQCIAECARRLNILADAANISERIFYTRCVMGIW